MGISVAKGQLLIAKIKKEHNMTNKNKKGFTIIEVVLVLAIAGLIFLMVFIALPALQRSQRNTQRADDMARIKTAVNQYQANNSGRLPFSSSDNTTWGFDSNFVKRYIDSTCGTGQSPTCSGKEFKDPDGNNYKFSNLTGTSVSGTTLNYTIYVKLGAKCGTTEGQPVNTSGKRDYAMYYIMEGGQIRCFDQTN